MNECGAVILSPLFNLDSTIRNFFPTAGITANSDTIYDVDYQILRYSICYWHMACPWC